MCDVELPYTSLGNVSGAIATDFSVSPDGTQIAFLQVDPTSGPPATPWTTESNDAAAQLPGGYVYIVPVNGGTPKQVSPTPAIYGPRWIGAGRSLIFTGLRGLTSAGLLETSVVVVQTDGTGQAIVATGDGVSTFVSTSGSAACNSAPGGRGAPVAGALLSLAAIAELVRRRRRR
jgi:Tol biopolymer transport system component